VTPGIQYLKIEYTVSSGPTFELTRVLGSDMVVKIMDQTVAVRCLPPPRDSRSLPLDENS
jgi:hypothetical protein